MIFKTKEHVQQFLIEINQIQQVDQVRDRDYLPTREEMTSFIKSRSNIIPKLKSFRKSQSGKENWRHNRYAMMTGIKKWHGSTEGKRFHRALARYNATRSMIGQRDSQKEESLNVSELTETLKGLSSLITHMYIEMDFYHPVDEQVDLEILIEESHPVIRRIEEKLLKLEPIEEDDLDLLLRLIDPEVLLVEVAQIFNKPIEQVKGAFESYLFPLNLKECGSYLRAFDLTRRSLLE